MGKFIQFLREQGVMALAIGFILGDAARQLVNSFVQNILNPLVGIPFSRIEGLEQASFTILGSEVKFGLFILAIVNFVALAAIVYYVFKGLKLEGLDLKKEK